MAKIILHQFLRGTKNKPRGTAVSGQSRKDCGKINLPALRSSKTIHKSKKLAASIYCPNILSLSVKTAIGTLL
jgi:hypothetical protein